MHSVHFFVYGHVQGVFFRKFVVNEALMLSITGYCRNRLDGSVEVLAEHADREVLEILLSMCWRGPRMAEVIDVRANWDYSEKSEAEFVDFQTLPSE